MGGISTTPSPASPLFPSGETRKPTEGQGTSAPLVSWFLPGAEEDH